MADESGGPARAFAEYLRERTGRKASRLEAELSRAAGRLSRYLDRWTARVKAAERDIDVLRARLESDREKYREQVAELEERLARLETPAALPEAERAAPAVMAADAVDDPGPAVVARHGDPVPRIWGAVPLHNPDFVGRTGLLHELRLRLFPPDGSPVLPQVLHGLAGVGKSQLVAKYLYTHATDYDLVWWIPAEHPTRIRSSFVDLARRMGIKAGSAETAVPAVMEALRTYTGDRGWLLVFDNADSLDMVRPYVPVGSGHVLIASRNPYWVGVARPMEIDLFDRDESIRLLRIRRPGLDKADADTLAEALGDLPLALSQIGSWLDHTGMPARECLRLLDEAGTELLMADVDSASAYEIPVAAAWNVPLDRLMQDSAVALRFLRLCAFFAPGPIPRRLLTDAPRMVGLEPDDGITLNAAIRELTRYSLVKVDRENEAISLHPLLRRVVRAQMPPEEHDAGCSGIRQERRPAPRP